MYSISAGQTVGGAGRLDAGRRGWGRISQLEVEKENERSRWQSCDDELSVTEYARL